MSAAPAAGARPPPAGEPAPGSAAATPAAKQGWRPVVTAFVRRSDGRVLVVKRSDKVSTYQGMWGGVSGGVEPADTSLLERAYDEIEEEVGIPRHCLRLACTGRPLPVRDGGRRFLVHPFLMDLADSSSSRGGGGGGGGSGGGGGGGGGSGGAEAAAHAGEASGAAPAVGGAAASVQGAAGAAAASGGCEAGDPAVVLNWENTEARWVTPSELGALPHVPLLQETLRRLVLPRYMAVHVEHLARDRVHGAAELADYAIQAFGVVAAYELKGDAQQHAELEAQQPVWQAVCEAYHNFAWHMACARPSMAAIANAAAAVMVTMDRELRARADPFGPEPAGIRVALLEAVRIESAKLKARSEQLRARAAALIPDGARVLTASYSSTVLAALTAARGRLGGVIVCESRPLCEGAAFARALAAAGVPNVTVITDAQAAAFVGAADLVLLGADALSEAGASNKVGSRLLALAAREEGVPVYACCDTGKIGPGGALQRMVGLGAGGGGGGGGGGPGVKALQEEKGADEVTRGWPRDLRAAGGARVGADAVAAAGGGGAGAAAGGGVADAPPAAPEAAHEAAAPLEGVTVRNVYFETVPLQLLAGVATEAGVMAADDIRAAVAERGRQYLEGFNLQTLQHPPQEGAEGEQL